jgi:hypothetical protein
MAWYLRRHSRKKLISDIKLFLFLKKVLCSPTKFTRHSSCGPSVCGIMTAIHHTTSSSSSLAVHFNLPGSCNYIWSFQLLSLKLQEAASPVYEPTVMTSISRNQQLPPACSTLKLLSFLWVSHNIYKSSPYLTETLRLRYKAQPVNAV